MQTTSARKWAVPLLCLILGVAYLVAFWLGGNLGAGIGGLAVMVAYGALLLAGGRSETIRTLRGQPTDERWRMFDLRATAFAGTIVITVLIGGFLYEMAQGQDGNPYSLLAAVAGISYIAALLWLRWRS